MHHQDRLDLGVVVRVVACEQLDRAARAHPEAGGRIGDALARHERDHAREDLDADAARRRAAEALAVGGEEARAGDHVELRVVAQVRQQHRDLPRVVLAVAVDLDRDAVAVLAGVGVTRLHRPADPEVERVAQHDRARRLGGAGGAVGRAVVDHDDVEVGGVGPQLRDHAGDRAALVVGGNDREVLCFALETCAHLWAFGVTVGIEKLQRP